MMRRLIGGALGLVAVASMVAIERAPAASADARPVHGQGRHGVALEHVGSFFVPDNLAAGEPSTLRPQQRSPRSRRMAAFCTSTPWPSGWGSSIVERLDRAGGDEPFVDHAGTIGRTPRLMFRFGRSVRRGFAHLVRVACGDLTRYEAVPVDRESSGRSATP